MRRILVSTSPFLGEVKSFAAAATLSPAGGGRNTIHLLRDGGAISPPLSFFDGPTTTRRYQSTSSEATVKSSSSPDFRSPSSDTDVTAASQKKDQKHEEKGSWIWDILSTGGNGVDLLEIPKLVAAGCFLLGFGIVTINVNERRAAKQHVLNEFAERRVTSVAEVSATPSTKEELKGKIVHVSGPVQVVGTPPRDPALGVEAPTGMLRLQREVEMYQWRVASTRTTTTTTTDDNTDKDNGTKEEKKEYVYTYTKEWLSRHQCTPDDRNPAFPKLGDIQEAPSLVMIVLEKLQLRLAPTFVQRLTNWVDRPVTITDSAAAKRHGLRLNGDQQGFYSKKGDPSNPQVGDVRVTYRCIEPGVFTALGKYDLHKYGNVLGIPKLSQLELQPFTAKLRKSLLSEGKVEVPNNAHRVAQTAGYDWFVIPDWVAKLAESMLLRQLPLEYAYLVPGALTKEETFASHRSFCGDNTSVMHASAVSSCIGGVFLMTMPLGVMCSAAQLAVTGIVGPAIAYTCRRNARWQLENASTSQGEPQATKWGRADVKI